MKTPIIYYGGKTNMLKHILPLIPGDHCLYVEPFFGGGAVFFGKQKSKVEVINDNLDMVINFYKIVQTKFDRLQSMIKCTLHAERAYFESKEIIKNPEGYTPLKRAWAFWCQTALTFSHSVCSGFAFSKGNTARSTANRRQAFTRELAERLEDVQIFCRDALALIRKYDSKETFFYMDPPYANSCCGHYEKGKDVFYSLLRMLPDIKGRWLLSSYPCPELDELRKLMGGINFIDKNKPISVSGKHNAGKRKTECLTWNYKI